MPSLIDVLLPNAAADVVAVFDSQLNQVFRGARPIKATVQEESKLMEHPVEDGTVITDNKIDLPVEIELSLLIPGLNYQSVYQQIKQLNAAGTLLTVQTRSGTYPNMLIQKFPHDEDPTMWDTLTLAMTLREAEFVTATYGTLPPRKVAKKKQSSTVNRGQQTTTPPAGREQSQLAKFGRFIKP